MSRLPRAGEASKRRSLRATDAEWAAWEDAAQHADADLSTWLRQAALELTAAGRRRKHGWMRPAARVTPGKARRARR